ncbi:tenascin-like isoform X2 [Maniola jurtina]|uniref:tenascin-like isoform X2 n=1 Tax=Maniola jurtina TaxID=191418 RepID=UPI001E6867F4|nr:tenascin-like isoform X2 [Maniola jurtina]
MFPLESIFFIAVLCVVNAAITVNTYEDDVETIRTNKLDEVESCNDGSCDRTCRLLGFDSGVCVGDTCECRKFHRDNDKRKLNDILSVDEGITGSGLDGCNPNACDQLCRRLKFPGGVCVNGRCKCDNFRREPEILEQNDIPSLDEGVTGAGLGGCDPNACDQLCRRLKFPGGVCVNGRCKCDNFRQEPEVLEQNDIPSLDESVIETGLGGCDPNACNQLCRRLKFPGGVCVNGRCKCDNFRREPEILEQNDISSLDSAIGTELGGCNPNACDQLCRRLKLPGGVCVNGRCKCDNFRQEPETMMEREVEEQLQAGCTNAGCSILCHLLGYRYGVCIGNTCKCSNALRTADGLEISLGQEIKEDIVNSVARNAVVTKAVRNCDPLACMMGCQELGFPGGSCFLDKCRCNKRDEEDEKRSWQACNNVNCYFMCRSWGYIGGSCRGGTCLCV